MQWQPIETAPKDGTVIILFDGKSVWAGRWIGHSYYPWVAIDNHIYGPRGLKAKDVTHWMPLPPPPTDEG